MATLFVDRVWSRRMPKTYAKGIRLDQTAELLLQKSRPQTQENPQEGSHMFSRPNIHVRFDFRCPRGLRSRELCGTLLSTGRRYYHLPTTKSITNTYYLLPTTCYLIPIVYYQAPTTRRLPPAAYRSSPVTHCRLPIAHCPYSLAPCPVHYV